MNINELKIQSEDLRIILEAGFILREAARFDEAESIFKGAIEFLPNSEVPKVGLGTVYLQKGDFSKAKEICESAWESNPNSLYARVHYAEALLFVREREKAENELREIIATDADSPHSQTAQALLDAADLIAPQ